MTQLVEVQQFAAFLRMLKNRTDRSYEALAKRTGVSSSSLHRYCAGTKTPSDFGSVQRFARECGATRAELHELHRLWALADAVRRSQPAQATATVEPAEARETAAPDDDRSPEDESTEPEPAGSSRFSRQRWMIAGAVVLALAIAASVMWAMADSGPREPPGFEGPMLMSPACPPVISMGQHDECVREVQNLLRAAGAVLEVDGDFGPTTLRRVTGFQLLSGLQARGVVDEPTKRALYEKKKVMFTWPPEQLEQRIRQVFPEEPDRAVGIAKCQSKLDPYHVLSNDNGTRNWGLFQLSDRLLGEMNGTALQALDPEWNIQTARRAWGRHRDFRDWEHCDQPFRTSPPAPTSAPR